MPRFIILHRQEGEDDPPRGICKHEEEIATTMEDAIRKCLTDEQILYHEYVVYEVDRSAHSDEFNTDGTFDDIAENHEQ